MRSSFDVLVAGGGPAGSIAALELSKLGLSVALIEQDNYQTFRVGETLPPLVRSKLTELGIWERFLACAPLESYGIRSAWETSAPREQDFVRNPYGCGWHVDRAHFDRMLASAAAEAGVELFTSARVVSCQRQGDQHCQLQVVQACTSLNLSGRVLVDATGRRALLASHLGSRAQALDRLIAIVTLADAGQPEQWTLIEAVETGWWYSAPLPDGRMVFAYLTDSDLWKDVNWMELIKAAPLTCQRAGRSELPSPIAIVSAGSLLRQPVVGSDWVAIGDAALAFDPLSGQGVLKSMDSGTRSAAAIARYLDHDSSGLNDYQNWVRENYQAHLDARARFYQSVRRWPSSLFWARRGPGETAQANVG